MEKPVGSLISFMANKVKSNGGINLAQGIPAFDPPQELLEILQQHTNDNIHQYAPGKGNHQLLELLEKYYNIPQKNFLIVNGATEAMSLLVTYILSIEKTDFSFLAFDPVYESYKHLPRIFNKKFVPFSFDDNATINFSVLEKVIVKDKVKVIFISSPGNPFGKVWTEQEMRQLVDICNKHKVYVIFDSVYSELYYNEVPFSPAKLVSEYVFYVNSFSKKFSITGWRIGYIVAHNSHMSSIMDVHDYVGLCAPSLLQQAIATYLHKYDFGKEYVKKLRIMLKENYSHLSQALEKLGFTNSATQGGYFVWAQLPSRYNDGLEFALKLYEQKKVATVPGIHFSEKGKRYIRFNIARYPEEINMAVKGIEEFLETKS